MMALLAAGAPASAQNSVFLEDLTWVEVRDAIKSGTTTVMIPTGGTEQGGPHLVLGKHNYVMKFTAQEIAKRLGHTLVAPVMAYVPEGNIEPPTSHMWGPGTITLPPEHFLKVVEYAARSLKSHGFLDIILIGDSGGNQEWASTPVRVYHLDLYNSNPDFLAWLQSQGYSREEIGNHAAIRDTSELMAAHLAGVRVDKRSAGPLPDGSRSGVVGNPTKASLEIGKKGLEMKIDQAIRQYRELKAEGAKPK
jgi:creatinine amidohydrolase/Fe(II)-dependent formamide hydrolase-like protein